MASVMWSPGGCEIVFEDIGSFSVRAMSEMGTIPRSVWEPNEFVYTGRYEVSMSMTRAQMEGARGLMNKRDPIPCVLVVHGATAGNRFEFWANAWEVMAPISDNQDTVVGALSGVLWDKDMVNAPVTDPGIIEILRSNSLSVTLGDWFGLDASGEEEAVVEDGDVLDQLSDFLEELWGDEGDE